MKDTRPTDSESETRDRSPAIKPRRRPLGLPPDGPEPIIPGYSYPSGRADPYADYGRMRGRP